AVYRTGACGVAITRSDPSGPSPGYFRHNAVRETAQDSRYDDPDYYCYQCALAVHAAPESFEISSNWFTGNRRATDDLPNYDMPEDEFRLGIEPLLGRLVSRPALKGSVFLARMRQ
ncbi:MAG: hypothetical protein ACE5GH_00475, partial [Fidelibacterota bacterium]